MGLIYTVSVAGGQDVPGPPRATHAGHAGRPKVRLVDEAAAGQGREAAECGDDLGAAASPAKQQANIKVAPTPPTRPMPTISFSSRRPSSDGIVSWSQ